MRDRVEGLGGEEHFLSRGSMAFLKMLKHECNQRDSNVCLRSCIFENRKRSRGMMRFEHQTRDLLALSSNFMRDQSPRRGDYSALSFLASAVSHAMSLL